MGLSWLEYNDAQDAQPQIRLAGYKSGPGTARPNKSPESLADYQRSRCSPCRRIFCDCSLEGESHNRVRLGRGRPPYRGLSFLPTHGGDHPRARAEHSSKPSRAKVMSGISEDGEEIRRFPKPAGHDQSAKHHFGHLRAKWRGGVQAVRTGLDDFKEYVDKTNHDLQYDYREAIGTYFEYPKAL
jgi:hypothetical protein